MLVWNFFIIVLSLDFCRGLNQIYNQNNQPGEACGMNEVYGCRSSCEYQCPRIENNMYGQINVEHCPPCEPGCVCAPGFIRDSGNGLCIGLNYCPLPEPACMSHEMFSVCGAACQPTCENREIVRCQICIPGYVCAPGYLRDSTTGRCVTPELCPSSSLICHVRFGKILIHKAKPSLMNQNKAQYP